MAENPILENTKNILKQLFEEKINLDYLCNEINNIYPKFIAYINQNNKKMKDKEIISAILIILKEKYHFKYNYAIIKKYTNYKITNYKDYIKEIIDPFFETTNYLKEKIDSESLKKYFQNNDILLSKIRSNNLLKSEYKEESSKSMGFYKCIEIINNLKYSDFNDQQLKFKYFFTEQDFKLLNNSLNYLVNEIQDKTIFNKFSPRSIIASLSYLVYSDMSQNAIWKIFKTSEVSLRNVKKSNELKDLFTKYLDENNKTILDDSKLEELKKDVDTYLPIILSKKYQINKIQLINYIKMIKKLLTTNEIVKYFTYHKYS